MLIPNHPNDERLSALASRETDATADATLIAHVSSCHRCTELVNELGALRAALAELPDLAPSRPLRLLPPVEAAPAAAADRLGTWARRFFAPVLASGAALALVGTIGTAAPAFGPMAQGGAAAASEEVTAVALPAGEPTASAVVGAAAEAAASNAPDEATASMGPLLYAPDAAGSAEDGTTRDLAVPATPAITDPDLQAAEDTTSDRSTLGSDEADQPQPETLAVERSPWPMVLFSGVALMIGALLLRWILVPRAG